MRRAVAAKFAAHADIRAILLATGDEEFVEDTSTDHYRGRGCTGHRQEHARADLDAHPHPAACRPCPARQRSGAWSVDERGMTVLRAPHAVSQEASLNQLEPSPKIVHLSWGRMEVESLGVGKDFKLYPGGGRE
jgi:hypothetical protein